MPVDIVYDPGRDIAILIDTGKVEPLGPLAIGYNAEQRMATFLGLLEEDPATLSRNMLSALWVQFEQATGAGEPEPAPPVEAPSDVTPPPEPATEPAPPIEAPPVEAVTTATAPLPPPSPSPPLLPSEAAMAAAWPPEQQCHNCRSPLPPGAATCPVCGVPTAAHAAGPQS